MLERERPTPHVTLCDVVQRAAGASSSSSYSSDLRIGALASVRYAEHERPHFVQLFCSSARFRVRAGP